tara:strand:+ start:379 stop:2100 length:1722 start_codon:yes stop_codon:yes gene_type:complete
VIINTIIKTCATASVSFCLLLGQVSVSASVDINKISKSETFGFKITALNVDDTPSVDISPLSPHFKVISGPAQQTNIQWINGSMTSSRTLSWTLLARKTGKINLPSLNVRVGTNSYKTNPIGIVVEKSLGKAQISNLFIEAKPNKEEIYLGEQVTVTFRLFTRNNLSVESIEYPKSIGFWSEDLLPARAARFNNTQINGINYKVATLYKSAMFPTQTGDLKISPMTAICNVETNQRKRRGVFDDPFFNSMFKETQRKFIESDTLSISVLPYPETPPADFTGAVGDFSINTWIDTSNVNINEAVTLHVALKGTGNLNQFKINQLNFPQSMEVFPPKSSFIRDEFRDQITGEQKFEYILIPRQSGSFKLSPISLTYFNPANEKFMTTRSKLLTLEVGDNSGGAIAYTGSRREDVSIIADDIRFIKTNKIKMTTTNNRISFWTLVPYLASIAFFLFPATLGRFTKIRSSSFDERMRRDALRVALKDLNRNESESLSYISSVMYKYFKSKLFLRTENLDPLILENSLKGRISSDNIDKVVEIAKLCDANRFSPTSNASEKKIIKDISIILKDIDKLL